MTRRRLFKIGLPLLVAVSVAGAALAYWSTSGTGSATASVATITGPSNVTAHQSGSDVTIGWDAATLSTGAAVEGYRVRRSDNSPVCGSPTLTTGLQCTDSNVPIGTYTYTVTAVYRSWTSTATSGSITVLAAPAITSKPSNPSADAAPSIAFSGGGGTSYQCQLDSGSFTTCSSPQSLKALNGNVNLGSGSHTFKAHAMQGGTAGPDATYTWTIDTSAPSLTSQPSSVSANNASSISFTHTQAAYTFKCKLDAGTFTTCSSPQSLKALNGNANLTDGSHTATVEALGADGAATQTTSYTWTVDTSAPSITSKPSDPSALAAPSISFTHTRPAYTFKCKLDAGSFITCSSPQSLTALNGNANLADGSHTVTVEAIDADAAATQTASSTWMVNTAAPTLTAKPSNPTNQTSATFSFNDTGYSSFQCKLDAGSFTACNSGTATYSGLSGSSHTFTVHALDASSNTTQDQVYTWVVDTTAPSVLSINRHSASPTAASSVQFDVAFSELVTGVDTTDFSLATSGVTGASISSVSGSGSSYAVTVTTGSGNGTIGLNLVDNDSISDLASNKLGGTGAGNGNLTGQAYTINRGSTITNFSCTPGSGHTVTFSGNTTENNGTVTVTYTKVSDGSQQTTTTTTFSGSTSPFGWTKATGNLGNGTSYTAQVTQVDSAGFSSNSPICGPFTT